MGREDREYPKERRGRGGAHIKRDSNERGQGEGGAWRGRNILGKRDGDRKKQKDGGGII
jgi:hypothetical protein